MIGRSVRAAALGIALGVAAGGALGCIEPKDQRPGFYVSGEVVSEPVSDWSFTDAAREIVVETRAWYLLPHSVTTHCIALNGKLYVGSLYREGGEFPDARPWNRNLVHDPRVRLKIGGKIYPGRAAPVRDPAETEAVLTALAGKYGEPWKSALDEPPAQRPGVHFFRVESRG